MCTCTIVYVDTSHENASVVGCYHELRREEEKKTTDIDVEFIQPRIFHSSVNNNCENS